MEARELKVLSFLRYIYDETRNDFVKISISKKAKEYEIPQVGIISTRLFKLGILQKDPSGKLYKWNIENMPSIELANKLTKAIADFWRIRDKEKALKKKETAGSKPEKMERKKTDKINDHHNENIKNDKKYLTKLSEQLSINDIINICKLKCIHGNLIVSQNIKI